MVMNERKKEVIKDNLESFIHNFGEVRIENFGLNDGYYVYYPADSDSYIQYCYNLDYLNGWLYGCVQGVHRLSRFCKL